MAVQVPTPEQVKAAAAGVGLSPTAEDIQSYIELMKPNVHANNLLCATRAPQAPAHPLRKTRTTPGM
jgi:hypothetical protein